MISVNIDGMKVSIAVAPSAPRGVASAHVIVAPVGLPRGGVASAPVIAAPAIAVPVGLPWGGDGPSGSPSKISSTCSSVISSKLTPQLGFR